MAQHEQVFVVRRSDFFGGDWPQGFVALGADAPALLAAFGRLGFFVDRPEAESNPAWKQLIPYCVLRRPGEVFCVQRKKAQTEARLHDLLSIGIGGHVNPQSCAPEQDGAAFLSAALQQELDEEMWIESAAGPHAEPVPTPRLLGMLNDDATEVGRVHAGLVYALDFGAPSAQAPDVRVREVSKMAGGFRHLADLESLWQDAARFESWSRILFQAGVAHQVGGPGHQAVSRSQQPEAARPEVAERNENG